MGEERVEGKGTCGGGEECVEGERNVWRGRGTSGGEKLATSIIGCTAARAKVLSSLHLSNPSGHHTH